MKYMLLLGLYNITQFTCDTFVDDFFIKKNNIWFIIPTLRKYAEMIIVLAAR